MDIRTPIGWMFALLGAVLIAYGTPLGAKDDPKPLGINVDLWWGLVVFGFGAMMLALARMSRRKVNKQ